MQSRIRSTQLALGTIAFVAAIGLAVWAGGQSAPSLSAQVVSSAMGTPNGGPTPAGTPPARALVYDVCSPAQVQVGQAITCTATVNSLPSPATATVMLSGASFDPVVANETNRYPIAPDASATASFTYVLYPTTCQTPVMTTSINIIGAQTSGTSATFNGNPIQVTAPAGSFCSPPQDVTPGQTASSSIATVPSATTPVIAAVTSPGVGNIAFLQTTTTMTAPIGYTLLGQQINIAAPPGTPASPLTLSFALDASIIPAGQTASSVQVFRNGAAVPDCNAPGGTTAAPDPCVNQRAPLAGGGVQIIVLTSSASAWNFGLHCNRPGNGFGDRNHAHCGAPGQTK